MSASNRGSDPQLERIMGAKSFDDLWHAQLTNERENMRNAERIILALRRKLIASDPTLPDEFDGTRWSRIEAEWFHP